MAFIVKLIKWVLVIVFAIFCIRYWLEHKTFIFSHDGVAAIAKKYAGSDPEIAFSKIIASLNSKYPGHILPAKDHQWIFMNAGGWMGSMIVLHASITEYILIFGTAMETAGHSGRYWANITDTIITGTFKQWSEGEIKYKTFKPGDTVYHMVGEVTAVSWTDNTWMVEYGRGFIPSTLGFALSDTFFSTQDFLSMYYILKVYTKALVQEAVFNIGELRHYLKDSL